MWITPIVVISLFALPLALCQSGSPSDARLPPTIIQGPTNGPYYRNGASLTLECKAHGVPEVSYKWLKNGRDLNLNGKNVRDGTITIEKANSLDDGFYQCIAWNKFGIALSNTCFMQMADILDNQRNTQVLMKPVNEGEPFCIEAYPSKSIPKAKPTWQIAVDALDEIPVRIALSRRIQNDESGYKLCFAYATTEDDLGGKIYKIRELNVPLDRTAGGSYTNVTVTRVDGGPKPFAPHIAFSSHNQTIALEGHDVTLSCFFYGNPEPDLAWNGPRNTLPIDRCTVGPYKSRLTIKNVRPSDEGNYTCSSQNGIGNNKHMIQMRVEAEPIFLTRDNQPHNVNVTEGDSLTFRCHAYAKPEATVVWLRNGEPLDLNSLPRRYIISNDKKALTIKNLCRDCTDRPNNSQSDLVAIQCNASNIHGYAFGAGYVNVLLKTTVVVIGEKDVSVDVNEEKEFTFECKATSDPSTPPKVNWYKETVEGSQPVHEELPALLLKDGILKIHVVPNKTQGFWDKYLGKYRCYGDNGSTNESVIVVLSIIPPPDERTWTGVKACRHFGAEGKGPPPPPPGTYWWIILLILLILLLLLLICICCICLRRNKGDVYDVDKKERESGHDPQKELVNHGFQDYQRPEDQTLKGIRGSLDSFGRLHSDDEASLMEYGDDPGKFTEDGSFVGAYALNTADRHRGRRE